jgi:uncharacterized membrane protein YoaK (UPF0700 family)
MENQPAASSLLPRLLLLLSVTTGLVDAISVLGLGKVFTANMTGNIVFMGFAAAGAPDFRMSVYLVAIAAFLLGALVAGRMARAHAGATLRRWLMTAALFEATLFWVAAGAAMGFDIASLTPEPRLFTIIALTAIAMGFRNATIRQLKVPDLTTTVLTLTITGLAADSHWAGGTNPNWARRVSAILAIFCGAFVGGLLVIHVGLAIPLLVAGAMILGGTMLGSLHPDAAQPME